MTFARPIEKSPSNVARLGLWFAMALLSFVNRQMYWKKRGKR